MSLWAFNLPKVKCFEPKIGPLSFKSIFASLIHSIQILVNSSEPSWSQMCLCTLNQFNQALSILNVILHPQSTQLSLFGLKCAFAPSIISTKPSRFPMWFCTLDPLKLDPFELKWGSLFQICTCTFKSLKLILLRFKYVFTTSNH